MLPDFPELKSRVQSIFLERFRLLDPVMAPLVGTLQKRIYHEGRRGVIIRADGSVDETDLILMSSKVTYSLNELEGIRLKDAFEKAKEAMEEIAKQREILFLETVSKAAESVGNDIPVQGHKISPEMIVRAIENVQFDFDIQGKPRFPTFVVNPEIAPVLESVISKLEEEPYKSRMTELVEKKKQEWRDRENNRKLVD